MIVHWQNAWTRIMVAGWVALATCSFCQGGASHDNELGVMGKYYEQIAAPDSLTTIDPQGPALEVKGGSASPDRPTDQGLVRLTSKNGPTAVFSGRSTDWGCAYAVNGVRVANNGGGGEASKWAKNFEEEDVVRIVMEINEDGDSDDVVLLGGTGTLRVWVLGRTEEVLVDLSANPTGIISGLPSSIAVTAGESSPASISISGQSVGSTVITASATVINQNISSSRTIKVLGFRGVIKPSDDFPGRSHQKVGVGETGTLDVEGANLDALKPLRWSLTAGDALEIAGITDNGTASFKAGKAYGKVTLTLTATGVTPQQAISYDITVVEPAIETAIKQSETNDFQAGVGGAGMVLTVTIHPTDVSFTNVEHREGSCKAERRMGYFGRFQEGALDHQPNPDWIQLAPGNLINDIAATGNCQPDWMEGGYFYNIPVRWRVRGEGRSRTEWNDYDGYLPNRSQIVAIDETGKVTVSKLGVTVTRSP